MQNSIAVIGIGCRFPGSACSPKALWKLLSDGTDAITEVPPDRWDIDAIYSAERHTPGKTYARWGGFLERIGEFDPHYFGMSPREAAPMDPQTRLMLEVALEAMEDGGQVPERKADSTGVFVGVSGSDYHDIQVADPRLIDGYTATGSALSITANRISHAFDFHGPSMAVDTACSSSLVAVHLACKSLLSGECSMALAGGVTLLLRPEMTIAFSKGFMLSPDGRCKAFDARGNGFVRGEGAGVVVLKRLQDALDDSDPIYAVVLSSVVNQDGHTISGIAVPNQKAQEAQLLNAYRKAGIEPSEVHYVEAHGPGTPVGDPIEAGALGKVLGQGRPDSNPLLIGSIKTNIGHLEPAAGIAGFIKAALCLKEQAIAPSLHFQTPNPRIAMDALHLRVPTTLEPWIANGHRRIAGVNSFGFGGTNAHVVLAGAELVSGKKATGRVSPLREQRPYLLPLSARTPEALLSLAQTYHRSLTQDEKLCGAPLADIAYTASLRRRHLEHRLAITAADKANLVAKLNAYSHQEIDPVVSQGAARADRPRIAFVFCGMGSQWWAMGRELLEKEPIFREAVQRCDAAIRAHADWSVVEELTKAEKKSRITDNFAVGQPAMFALQVGLAALWRSWGLEPDAIVGHSVGEVAAAYVAGALTLKDAALVIFHRSRLQHLTRGQGSMAAIALPAEGLKDVLAPYLNVVSVAAINSPDAVTLSGQSDAIETIVKQLDAEGVFCRILRVPFPAHSPLMEHAKSELRKILSGIKPHPANIPLYSTVTGNSIQGSRLDAIYWGENTRNPVLFAAAAKAMVKDGYDTFVEISPHPALASSISECAAHVGQTTTVLPSLRQEEVERETLLSTLGQLYCQGFPIDWQRFYPGEHCVVPLPNYTWQRQQCWKEPPISERTRLPRIVHPLLGHQLDSPQPTFESDINQYRHAYLYDHCVQGAVIYPGAAYMEMALAAAASVHGEGTYALKDVELLQAMFTPREQAVPIRLVMSSEGSFFEIYSQTSENAGQWLLHSRGHIRRTLKRTENYSPDAIRERAREQLTHDEFYAKLTRMGDDFGPMFKGVKRVWINKREVLARIELDPDIRADLDQYQIHPVLLDALFQSLIGALEQAAEGSYLPVRLDTLKVHRHPVGDVFYGLSRLTHQDENGFRGDLHLLDEEGQLIVNAEGFQFRCLEERSTTDAPGSEKFLHVHTWEAMDIDPGYACDEEHWLIFADEGGISDQLSQALIKNNQTITLVRRGESFAQPMSNEIYVRPDQIEDFHLALRRLLDQGNPLRGVLYCWTLDDPLTANTTLDGTVTSQIHGVGAITRLVQVLSEIYPEHLPQLWLITRGVHVLAPDDVKGLSVTQSPVWGLGRVLANEHPELQTRLIDLDPLDEESSLRQLTDEMFAQSPEDEVAFRRGKRHVHRLQNVGHRILQTNLPLLPLTEEATYLVVGGLGGFGLLVAHWLAECGARHLVLMSRRGAASEEAQTALERLSGAGVEVTVSKADVSDATQVDQLIEHIQEKHPPLRGLIHSAMVLDDGLIRSLDQAKFDKVASPKIQGAWNLHEATKRMPLDFFVLFSSVVSVIGNPGQGNYAAANAFLDALAEHRRALGLPALSVQWGSLGDVGYVAQRAAMNAHLKRIGLIPLPSKQALKALGALLPTDRSLVAVSPIDWEQWCRTHAAGKAPRFANVSPTKTGTDNRHTVAGGASLREAISHTSPLERPALVHNAVAERAAKVLGIAVDRVGPTEPLNRYGLDSLMAVELRTRLRDDFDVDIQTMKIVGGASVAQLAEYALSQLRADGAAVTDDAVPIEESEASESAWFANIKRNTSAKLRLLCFPYNGGRTATFHAWGDSLPDEIEAIAVRLPGQLDRATEAPADDLGELIRQLSDEIAPLIDKPYVIYGHSLGAFFAFELVRHLRKVQALLPMHLFVGAFHAPHLPDPFPPSDQLTDAETIKQLGLINDLKPLLADTAFMKALKPILSSGIQLFKNHHYRDEVELPCPITAFGGSHDPVILPSHLAEWARHTSASFDLETLPGGHLFVDTASDVFLPKLCARLTAILAQFRERRVA